MSDDLDKNQPRPPAGNAPRGSRRNQQSAADPSAGSRRPKRGNPGTSRPRKHQTQQQKEAMYQRWLYIGLGAAAALIVLSLGVGALWQYQIMPNQTLATVNGETISRKDYWKYYDITLYNTARQYENQALTTTGQAQSQALLLSAQYDAQREEIEGTTDVDEQILSRMIEDKLYVQAAEEQGVDFSQPILRQTALNTYAPLDAQLVTPIPEPTLIPQRAEWESATQTAEAEASKEAEEAMMTQEAMNAEMLGTPAASPVVGTPVASPVVEATPDMANVQSEAESDYQLFLNDVLSDTDLSEEEYLELFAKPQVARAHVDASIVNDIPQSAPQVEVQHIMVSTEELANTIYGQLSNGETTFEDAAAFNSLDTGTAGNSGKLGWVTEGELPDSIDDVIFDLEPNVVSEPIQTDSGWHIMMVTDKDDDRALTDTQYTTLKSTATEEFLETARAENDIESDHYNPVAAEASNQFIAPADAPTAVAATPVTAPDLSATPIAGPQLNPEGEGTPAASPVASPVASPAASPVATP